MHRRKSTAKLELINLIILRELYIWRYSESCYPQILVSCSRRKNCVKVVHLDIKDIMNNLLLCQYPLSGDRATFVCSVQFGKPLLSHKELLAVLERLSIKSMTGKDRSILHFSCSALYRSELHEVKLFLGSDAYSIDHKTKSTKWHTLSSFRLISSHFFYHLSREVAGPA